MHQIWISFFSRHFYEVNLILVLPQIHRTNFDEIKILFIFYDIIFKAMTFSVCSEADQNISDRLKSIPSFIQMIFVLYLVFHYFIYFFLAYSLSSICSNFFALKKKYVKRRFEFLRHLLNFKTSYEPFDKDHGNFFVILIAWKVILQKCWN